MPPLAHRMHVFQKKQRSPLEKTKDPFPDFSSHLRDGFRRYCRGTKPKRFIFGTEHPTDDPAVTNPS
jgi:hypothetical protein